MLPAEHLENSADPSAPGKILDSRFIILLLVVDPMLQAEFPHPRQFLVGR
jgi:hypothetical protein